MKLSLDPRDIALGFVIVIAILLFVLSSSKDTQISVLKKQLSSIDSKYSLELNETVLSYGKQIEEIEKSNNVLYSACISVTECKEIYNFNFRAEFLENAGLNGSKQLRREAYLLKSGMPEFSEGMDFVKKSCPAFKAWPLGTLYSLYHYSLKNDTIGVIMNDDTVNVHCAWIKKGGSYSAIFP